MQSYAGGVGVSVKDYLDLGVPAENIFYGMCSETGCSGPTLKEAMDKVKTYNLKGIHNWRLNSGNYKEEDKVQREIYNKLHNAF